MSTQLKIDADILDLIIGGVKRYELRAGQYSVGEFLLLSDSDRAVLIRVTHVLEIAVNASTLDGSGIREHWFDGVNQPASLLSFVLVAIKYGDWAIFKNISFLKEFALEYLVQNPVIDRHAFIGRLEYHVKYGTGIEMKAEALHNIVCRVFDEMVSDGVVFCSDGMVSLA